MKSVPLSFFIVLVSTCLAVAGGIYNYETEDGSKTYTNVPTKNKFNSNSGNKHEELLNEFGEDVEIIEPFKVETDSHKIILKHKKDTSYLDSLNLELEIIDNKLYSIQNEIDYIKSVIPRRSTLALDYLPSHQARYLGCLRALEDDTYITQYYFYDSYYWGIYGSSVTYSAVDPSTKVYCKQLLQDQKDSRILYEQGNTRINALESQYTELSIYRESIWLQFR